MRVAAIQAEALAIVASKNGHYGSSWRHQGWLGNLSRVLEKTDRLRAMLWNTSNPLLNGTKEHPRETALDMMNTLAFMIVNMDDGVERGNEPQAAQIAAWPPADGFSEAALSYGRPELDHPANAAARAAIEGVGEQTATLRVPGEEPVPQPSPQPRKVAVQDRGSGPRNRRPIKDAPQA